MDQHAHHWRATSKVFALVCECGIIYHDWLVVEIDRLKQPTAPVQGDTVFALQTQLEETRKERDVLRAELEEARRELEARAQAVAARIG